MKTKKKTGSRKKEKRLKWFGHIFGMDNTKTVRQATQ